MILAHAEEEISSAIELPVGVTQRTGTGQRLRFGTKFLQVKTLIGKIGKNNGPIRNRVVAAAVFVHSRSRVEPCRRNIHHRSIRGASDDDLPTAFASAPLDPINIIAVDSDLLKPNLAAGD